MLKRNYYLLCVLGTVIADIAFYVPWKYFTVLTKLAQNRM